MSKIKKLAGETALYGLGSIVPRALGFLLVPLHTRFFTTDQYGVYSNLLAYVAFLNVVYTFGMETAFFRYATAPGADAKRVFNLAQTCVVTISVILSGLLVGFSGNIAVALHISEHPEFLIWLAIVMLLDAVVAIPFARLRLEKKPLKFAAAKIINVIINVGLNYYFLETNYLPTEGIGMVFLANLLANLFYLFYFGASLLRWRPMFESHFTSTMIRYSYPVMLMGVAGMTNEMFSRLTLQWWLPQGFYGDKSAEHALGVFGACYKYSMIMGIAIQAFRFAAEPFFFSNASEKNSPDLFSRVNHYFVITCCVIWLGVSINLDIFQYFIGTNFREGMHIVPILLLGYLFQGMYFNFSVWFKVTDKTYFGTLITAGGAVLTMVLNYLLIPIAGYTGSSWATLIVYASMALMCYKLGQRYYPIPYRVGADLAYLVATFLAITLIARIPLPNLWVSGAAHGALMLVFVAIIYFVERKNVLPTIS